MNVVLQNDMNFHLKCCCIRERRPAKPAENAHRSIERHAKSAGAACHSVQRHAKKLVSSIGRHAFPAENECLIQNDMHFQLHDAQDQLSSIERQAKTS